VSSPTPAPITGMGITQLARLGAPRKGACATAAYEQHEEGRSLAGPPLLSCPYSPYCVEGEFSEVCLQDRA
jgi:hypothetical protein